MTEDQIALLEEAFRFVRAERDGARARLRDIQARIQAWQDTPPGGIVAQIEDAKRALREVAALADPGGQ